MSETTSAPVGVESPVANNGDADYEKIVEQLDAEGLVPTTDHDDPDQEGEELSEEDGEPKIKLKVNGRTTEHTQAEVVKFAQMYKATEMKLETAKKEIDEARATKRELESQQSSVRQLLSIMQKGDIETITEFVTDKLNAGDVWNKAIIQHALKLYEMSKMTPEQREHMENKKLISKMRQEAEDRQKSEQDRAFQYQVNQWEQHINVEVPKAIKQVGLPDTALVREHIISTWRSAIERGKTPTAMAVANFVKGRLDEAKMLGVKAPVAAPVTRPRATNESVGRNKMNGADTGYLNWDTWKKTRGN